MRRRRRRRKRRNRRCSCGVSYENIERMIKKTIRMVDPLSIVKFEFLDQ